MIRGRAGRPSFHHLTLFLFLITSVDNWSQLLWGLSLLLLSHTSILCMQPHPPPPTNCWHIWLSSCFLTSRSLHVDTPPTVPTLTSSYVHGTSSASLLHHTVSQSLDSSVQRWPDREAVIFLQDGIRKTFSQFQQDVSVGLGTAFTLLLSAQLARLKLSSRCRWIKWPWASWLWVCVLGTGWVSGDPTHTSGSFSSLHQPKLES